MGRDPIRSQILVRSVKGKLMNLHHISQQNHIITSLVNCLISSPLKKVEKVADLCCADVHVHV